MPRAKNSKPEAPEQEAPKLVVAPEITPMTRAEAGDGWTHRGHYWTPWLRSPEYVAFMNSLADQVKAAIAEFAAAGNALPGVELAGERFVPMTGYVRNDDGEMVEATFMRRIVREQDSISYTQLAGQLKEALTKKDGLQVIPTKS